MVEENEVCHLSTEHAVILEGDKMLSIINPICSKYLCNLFQIRSPLSLQIDERPSLELTLLVSA